MECLYLKFTGLRVGTFKYIGKATAAFLSRKCGGKTMIINRVCKSACADFLENAVRGSEAKLIKAASRGAIIVAGVGFSAVSQGMAFDLGPEITADWTNTVKYTAGVRTGSGNSNNLNDPNSDEIERNFDEGDLVMNRVDLLTELNLKYQNFTLNLSGAGWYDDVYNSSNSNDSPQTFNPFSVENDQFTSATKRWAGQSFELMNAFVGAQFEPGGMPLSFRLGRHTLLWGESLFFTDNGIASAMAPVDVYKALSVPNIKAQEVFLPVNQLSASALLSDEWTVEAFYQFEWEKSRLPPVGTFFASTDVLDEGGERIIVGPGAFLYRGSDDEADAPQFGVSLRWRPAQYNFDLGLYAIRYNYKEPRVMTELSGGFDPATGSVGTYHLEYKENIELYGVSVNSSIDNLNLGAELSYRHNIPLRVSTSVLQPDSLGDTVNAQVSAIYVGNAGMLWDNITFAGEIAGHKLAKVTRNGDQRDTTLNSFAYGARGVVTLDYYQVAPSLDLSVPIGIGYVFKGRSPTSGAFGNYGENQGGDVTVGLATTYKQTWQAAINYTKFFGNDDDNRYVGRDFVALTLSTSF
ncbi:DUF1302 domain-containing protein [Pseudomonas sp. BN414]|uniref:DUF1302 domain-containing protein n=1 Tax=unclassified Pseudomonas TaxID=196821 RepID=UPI00245677F2|nr:MULTISPECIES: DUF1302 domain-containing protein [unclassified Pseudomonas]MDH4568237.1 DUF1302 domain-containing protein [Pseudomonas sp. BN414]MDH4580704.1 DUF1302 domain-containing protein [Pseudomonas sp. BN415]